MIPRIQQERPNVIKRYYCSACGTKLQHSEDVNQEPWRFCPMCGEQIEWDEATDVVWEEKSCDICGGWLIEKHPLGFWYASSDYIGENTCRTCWLEECCTTNCLSCQRRQYPDCEWVHLKQFYLEEEQHGD